MKPAPRPASAFPDNVVRLELPPTDAELVLAARAGRERALDQLFHRYPNKRRGLPIASWAGTTRSTTSCKTASRLP